MSDPMPAERLEEIVRTLNSIQAELEWHGHSLSGYPVDVAALEVERDANRARMPASSRVGGGVDRPPGT